MSKGEGGLCGWLPKRPVSDEVAAKDIRPQERRHRKSV